MAESDRVSGIVRWFSGQKGFGFVAPDGAGEGEDVFVHQTSIRSDGFRTLTEGEVVEFVIEAGEDGRSKAIDVVSLSRSRFSDGGPGRGRGGRVRGRGGRGHYVMYDEGHDGGYGRGGGRGGGRRGGRIGAEGGGGGGGGACYNCGQVGHLARNCYEDSSGGGGGYRGGGGGRGGYGGRGRGGYDSGYGSEYIPGSLDRGRGRDRGGGGKCYNCGEEGHFARECPNNQN